MLQLVVSVVLLATSALADPPKPALPDASFRDLIIFNHLTPDAIRGRTLGIETEARGLPSKKVVEILVKVLGGTYVGDEVSGTEMAHVVQGSAIGKIKVEPVNLMRLVNRFKVTNPDKKITAAVLTSIAAQVDKLYGTYEIVTEPLSYEGVLKYGEALDALGVAGAKGSANFIGMVSTQVNVGIDPYDIEFMKSALRNYYDNAGAIRAEVKPILMRQGYLNSITPEFVAQLNDPNWKPTPQEFYEAYSKGSAHKLARINFFNAILSDPENFARFEQPAMGKQVIPRPVAEFREANTVLSSPSDPTASSRHLLKETDFAIAFLEASKDGQVITLESEKALFWTRMSSLNPGQQSIQPMRITLRDILDPKYFVPMVTRPIDGASVIMSNPEVLARWGIVGTQAATNATVLSRFGHEVDNSRNPLGSRSTSPDAPIATAHNDAAGGVGDGRAFSYSEINGSLPSSKGVGQTPYTMKKGWAMMLGLHTGGTDGKMRLKEGVRVWITGEILNAMGIESERTAALLDNHGTSVVEGKADAPSAVLVRDIPAGGIRNSHLYEWDSAQTRRGLEYLKAYAESRTGFAFTDTAYVVYDAVKSGQMAARMQDGFILHGALAKGNVLAYPGLIDIGGTEFLAAPDPEYASFAYLSRFGNQKNRLGELMVERQQAYAKTNPVLEQLDARTIFEDAFAQELGLLTLERIGLTRAEAIALQKNHPEAVNEFTTRVWEAQFNRLQTDMRQFLLSATQRALGGTAADPTAAARQIAQSSRAGSRVNPGARREWLGNAKNRWNDRYAEISESEATDLVSRTRDLLSKAVRGGAEPAQIVSRAAVMRDFRPPMQVEVKGIVEKITEAHGTPESAQALRDGLDFIKRMQCKVELSVKR